MSAHLSADKPMDGVSPEGRRKLLANGYDPILLNGKAPVSEGWQVGTITSERLAGWESENPAGANTGLRTGKLAVIDIDLWEPEHAAAVSDAVQGVLGLTPFKRIGAKGLQLLYRNVEEPLRKVRVGGSIEGGPEKDHLRKRTLVEIMGQGGQIAAYGIHPDSGEPFYWPEESPLDAELEALPRVTRANLRRAAIVARDHIEELGAEDVALTGDTSDQPREVRPIEGDAPVTPDMLQAMFAHVDPECPRFDWIGWLGVIAEAPLVDSNGEPVEDFDREAFGVTWSAGDLNPDHSPGNYEGPDDVADAIGSLGNYSGKRKTLGSLVEEARRNGYAGPTRAYTADEVAAVHPPAMIEAYHKGRGLKVVIDNTAPNPEPVEETEEADRPLTAAELAAGDFPRALQLWTDFLLEGHPNSLDGDGGLGKTQALVQIGVAIASGRALFQRGVRQRPVLLLLCEDDKGEVKHRLEKVCAYLEVDLAELPLEVWCRVGEDSTLAVIEDNGEWREGEFYPRLSERLKAIGQPCFLGLDTVSDVANMDENKRAPMNTLAKKVLGGFSRKYGTTSLLTRHPSKASMSDGSYYAGSTSANAAFRNRLLLKAHEKGTGRTLSVVKSNYGLNGSVDLHHSGDVLRHLGDMEERQRIEAERANVLALLSDLRGTGIPVQRSHGNGQKPKDLAATLESEYGLDIDHKTVLAHLRDLERHNRIHWVASQGGKNKREATFEIGPRPNPES